jgi:hypothetical protein
MSVQTSIINGQSGESVDQLLPPEGLNLSNSMTRSLSPQVGAVAYDISTTALYLGTSTSTWTRLATGTSDVTLAAFGSSPNANAATLTGQILNLQPASLTFPGGVSTTTQSFNGLKDFSTSGIVVEPVISGGVQNTFNKYCRYAGTLTWSGAIAVPVVASYVIEKVGDLISFRTDTVNPGTQGAGDSFLISTAVPTEFRPNVDVVAEFTVIDASLAGGTPTDATRNGYIYLRTDGTLNAGLRITNDGTLLPFGHLGVTGSGNGIPGGRQTVTFNIA